MWLIQKKNTSITIFCVLIFYFISLTGYSIPEKVSTIENKEVDFDFLIISAKKYYNNKQYSLAIQDYRKALEDKSIDSIKIFRDLAFSYTKVNEPKLASEYIEKYIKASLHVAFINHSYFDDINDSESYQLLANKYSKKVSFLSIFCLYVGFLGVFIAVILNLRRRSDKMANFLMSAFVLQHSFFIIHISLLLSNYVYYLPHSLYISTPFSFLYGPLIYFYFKRVTLQYEFRSIDLLHLIPTLGLILLLLPVYVLSSDEKLSMILHREQSYMALISISKLITLMVYGGLVIKIYLQLIKKNVHLSRIVFIWQRNIVFFCAIYVVSYTIYSVLIIQYIFSGFLFYLQIMSMALLVLYVSYTAFVQPSIFGSLTVIRNRRLPELDKYKKSGLTESLSLELKEKLEYLLYEEKIYKQNDITLQKLAESLDTTRHNASQIINEHFNINFFELINKYRIEEAKVLLIKEKHKNFNIIDVAYEVGFNNKVTFNKSFKKYNQITPSEFVKSFVA